MATKEIKFSFEARDRMLRGIDILARAVRVTLGPRGRNVAIDRSFGAKITKDGVGVANEIELGDKFENMGVQLVRQVATKTSHQAGDGTTTAVVLAQQKVSLPGIPMRIGHYSPISGRRKSKSPIAMTFVTPRNSPSL